MQVGIDIKCMHTSFGGRDLSLFGNFANLEEKITLES